MIMIRNLIAIVAYVCLAATVQAQPAPVASAPLAGDKMSQDCAKPMAKHDHGAEKGMPKPTSKSGPCASTAAAPGAASSAPKKSK